MTASICVDEGKRKKEGKTWQTHSGFCFAFVTHHPYSYGVKNDGQEKMFGQECKVDLLDFILLTVI